jgi:hypothetical protein
MPEDESPRRGRPPRAEPANPTGYRCTLSVRRQLQLAIPFLGVANLQSVIDRAVREFLARLRSDVPGFAEAVEAAERNATGRPQNVRRLAKGR